MSKIYTTQYWNKDKTVKGHTQNHLINPVLEKVHQVQQKLKLVGNIGEIGVHEGKSFIPLLMLLNENERGVAIDCFEQQNFNTDNSGRGNQNILKTNCDKFGLWKKVDIHKGNSVKMKPSDWNPSNNLKFKIFSIDGSHTKDATYIDIKNVLSVLHDDGVIIIDDYLNLTWPGVKAGTDKFLSESNQLRPIFLGYNKLFLVKNRAFQHYWNIFKNVKSEILNKNSSVYKSQIKDVLHFEQRMKIGKVWK